MNEGVRGEGQTPRAIEKELKFRKPISQGSVHPLSGIRICIPRGHTPEGHRPLPSVMNLISRRDAMQNERDIKGVVGGGESLVVGIANSRSEKMQRTWKHRGPQSVCPATL